MVHVVLFGTILMGFALRNRGKQAYILPFSILFLFSSLRYMFGSDYISYYRWFEKMKLGAKTPFKEVLFTWLYDASPSFFLLIAVTSLLYCYAIYYLLKKNLPAKYICFGLFILLINPYLFLMNLSAIRQSIAAAILIFAVPLAIRKKWIWYCVLIVFASLFHASAILLLPFFLVVNDRPVKIKWLVLISVLVFVLCTFPFVQNVAEDVAEWFNSSNYLSYFEENEGNSLRSVLLTSIFYVYVIANLKKLKGTDLIYSKLYLVGLIFGILTYQISMFTRFQMYFEIFSVVSLPAIFKANMTQETLTTNDSSSIWKTINRFVLPALIITVFLLRYYSFFTNPMWKSFFTYQTILTAPIP